VINLLGHIRTFLFALFRLRTLGASVLAVDDGGKVLLIRQTYGTATWKLPGGGVKRRESFVQGALREAREEVGLELTPSGRLVLLGVYTKRTGGWIDHVAVFIATGWTLEPNHSWEIKEVATFDPDALPDDVGGATRRRIEEYRGLKPVDFDW